jgi:hypothetical protein
MQKDVRIMTNFSSGVNRGVGGGSKNGALHVEHICSKEA